MNPPLSTFRCLLLEGTDRATARTKRALGCGQTWMLDKDARDMNNTTKAHAHAEHQRLVGVLHLRGQQTSMQFVTERPHETHYPAVS